MFEPDEIIILRFPKTSCPNYVFITTHHVHDSYRHVLSHTPSGKFCLCISKNQEVRLNEADGIMFGFHRDTIEQIDYLIEMSEKAEPYYNFGQGGYNVNRWATKVFNLRLRNVKTGEIYSLRGKKKLQAIADLKIARHKLQEILFNGRTHPLWQLMPPAK